jgi:hypothetical protein
LVSVCYDAKERDVNATAEKKDGEKESDDEGK